MKTFHGVAITNNFIIIIKLKQDKIDMFNLHSYSNSSQSLYLLSMHLHTETEYIAYLIVARSTDKFVLYGYSNLFQDYGKGFSHTYIFTGI